MDADQSGRTGGPMGQCGLCQDVRPLADLSDERGGTYCAACAERRARHRAVVHADRQPFVETLLTDRTASPGDGDDHRDPVIVRAAWEARYEDLREKLRGGFPGLPDVLDAGEAAEHAGLLAEAIGHYRDAVSMVPGHPLARARLRELEPDSVLQVPVPAEDVPFGRTRRRQSEDPPFWSDLGSVVSYPFHGKGKAILAAASLFFAITEVIAQVSIVGVFVAICMWGYVVAYQFDVVSATAAGKKEPPEFPEVASLLESMVFPLFAWIACGFVSFLPFLGVLALGLQGVLPPILVLPLGLITFALGFFVFPMSLTVRALFQSVGPAVNPGVVLGSIGRIFPDYLGAFIAIGAVWVIFSLVNGIATILIAAVVGAPTADAIMVMDVGRILGWLLMTLVKWPLLLVALTLEAHVLGRMYRQAQVRLAWFVDPTDATARAQKMSGALALCALLAAALVTGGGWLTWNLLGVARTGVSAMKTSCPIRDGSSLTYYWENTDGPAGLVRYDFDELPSGDLQVSVSTQFAGFDEIMGEPRPFATFDPDTNTWTSAGEAYVGEVSVQAVPGMHVPFYGPTSARIGGNYVNTSQVKEATRWSETWDVWRVVFEGSSTDHLYDQNTGLLVGKAFHGVGFQVAEWLTSAENLPSVGDCPPPNRTF